MIYLRRQGTSRPPMAVSGGHVLRGLGANPLVSGDETARQEAELGKIQEIVGGLETQASEAIAVVAPTLGHVYEAIQSYGSKDPAEFQRSMANAIASAANLAGPVGAALGALLRIFEGLAEWLAKSYPATQIICSGILHRSLPAKLGYTGEDAEARCFREDQWLYVASFLMKGDSTMGFRAYNDGENYAGILYSEGSIADREANLAKACKPKYQFVGDPPVGYRTWQEFIRWADRQGAGITDELKQADAASAAIGVAMEERLAGPEGELQYFGWQNSSGWNGSGCWASGFAFKVKALDNPTLVDLILRLAFAAEGEDVVAVQKVQPITIPGLPTQANIVWRSGLAEAIMHVLTGALSTSPYLTYHVHALISEYGRRVAEGTIKVPSQARTMIARATPQLTFRPAAGRGVRVSVGSVTGSASVTRESPLTLRTAALMPVGSGLSAVIDGVQHTCDCKEVRAGEIECSCRRRK